LQNQTIKITNFLMYNKLACNSLKADIVCGPFKQGAYWLQEVTKYKWIYNHMNLQCAASNESWQEPSKTAILVLADGTLIYGEGLGATGVKSAEICFNTSITGYQEILSDPSYAGQIVTFTFPHIGNVGTNDEDIETVDLEKSSGVRGCITKASISVPSNWRSLKHLDEWLKTRDIIGIAGIDTRALTALIREKGLTNAVIAHDKNGHFDIEKLKRQSKEWAGLEGQDLVPEAGSKSSYGWDESTWDIQTGYTKKNNTDYHVVAIDYGMKRNIARLFVNTGCRVTVVPASTSAKEILALQPDGVFLSNGPGDPAATGQYAVPVIQAILEKNIPTFGICLGHQLLGLALGAQTKKMHQGHHGANHPVKDITTGKVEITSMNHGFTLDANTFPKNIKETHISLFDKSNCGIEVINKPVFSVQYHPEASPGPQDSHYLFVRFLELIQKNKSLQKSA
jgi:carbamoyl-phosphate synthase small subunit